MKLDTPFDPEYSKTSELLDENWKGRSTLEMPRPYLGISYIGHKCARYIWLTFRWAFEDVKEGRVERLLRRGQREEAFIVSSLRDLGFELDYVLDNQLDLDFGCHVKGHPDGLILSGVPEAPKTEHIAEFKTHNDKSFNDLKKNGIREAKPMHYIQMQCEMLGTSIKLGHKVERSLYYAVNKNTDEVYTHRFRYEAEVAKSAIERGQTIALMRDIPSRLSDSPCYYECKMCPFYGYCHGADPVRPNVNCRTCRHAIPKSDGTWECAVYPGTAIPYSTQITGCPCHCIRTDLAPFSWKRAPEADTAYSTAYDFDGEIILNGFEGVSSLNLLGYEKEIREAEAKND